jgi:hypothetical protein
MEANKIKQNLEKIRNQALQQLDDLRTEIHSIDEELHWLEHAPLSLDDALANIDRYINAHAEDSSRVKGFFYQQELAAPSVFDAPVKLGQETLVLDGGRVIGCGVASLAEVLIPLVGPSAIQRMLHEMAQREAENMESGPPLAERSEMKATLQKRKYALEVEEEALICSAEELEIDGFYRRSDVNPEVVLMMEV